MAKVIGGGLLGWSVAQSLRAGAISRATVLYDGGCPMCRGAVARLRRWDAGHRLEYLDARDLDAAAARFPHLPHDDDLREMRVVLPDGAVLGGFDAVRALTSILPGFRPLAPLMFLPGVRPLGVLAYRFVGERRPQTYHCTDDHCDLRAR
jgi:predicted DCC family thiol-disulfide oxidoreductase YuxK